MRVASWMTAAIPSAMLLLGCKTVPYNPATSSDTTAPAIGIRVTGDDTASVWNADSGRLIPKVAFQAVEVGAQVPGSPIVPVLVDEHGEVSVLATAQDDESGVDSLTLSCQRQVFYNFDPAGPTESNALLLPVRTTQDNALNNGQAPLSALQQRVMNMWGQMVFTTAEGTQRRAHRVGITCSAWAKNFNGMTARSHGVLVWAQDHAVQP
jgi:hypothetical protein